MQSKAETRKFRIPYVLLCTGCCGGREQQESIRGWEDVRSEKLPGRGDGKDDSGNGQLI